jgi:hypothetical protein
MEIAMSYITTQVAGKIGETVNAVLSDNDDPHQQRGVPVRAKLLSERVLCVDDEPRGNHFANDAGQRQHLSH